MTDVLSAEEITARWTTIHDRSAADYTDAGCRVLAEHAFRDVPWLLARLANAEAGIGYWKGLAERDDAKIIVHDLRRHLHELQARLAAAEAVVEAALIVCQKAERWRRTTLCMIDGEHIERLRRAYDSHHQGA